MTQAKNFMMIFRFEPNFSYQPSQEEQEQQHQAWGAFIGNLAIQEKLVSTHQLGFSGRKIGADQSIEEGIAVSDGQTLGGNMVVSASSLEEATELAKACPILHIGGTVEVRDIIPMA